jgi:hypothetical protein
MGMAWYWRAAARVCAMLMDMERESRWLPSHTILALLLTD